MLGFKPVDRPSSAGLPTHLRGAVDEIARELARAGHRAWLVGGAVRDLALGLTPEDADLASAAEPVAIAALFPKTYAVGKAFGTIVVHQGEVDIEVTTFRAESDYADGRRPATVRFASTLEEDARRRDFTCNALYLDPLTDEFADPTGGLSDLRARRLRCVGDPLERFGEDGLRILRMARLAAQHGFAVDPATKAGAARALASLRGVSPERVLAELERVAAGPAPARALGLLHEVGALERVVLGVGDFPTRIAALGRLGAAPGIRRLLATLFRPAAAERAGEAQELVRALRATRADLDALARIWRLEAELERCLEEAARGPVPRSRLVRLVRAADFEDARAGWRAAHPEERTGELARLDAFAASLGEERFPEPFVQSADLARLGVARGPQWGALLDEAEQRQLDQEFRSREEALAWLARRWEELQSAGGKSGRR